MENQICDQFDDNIYQRNLIDLTSNLNEYTSGCLLLSNDKEVEKQISSPYLSNNHILDTPNTLTNRNRTTNSPKSGSKLNVGQSILKLIQNNSFLEKLRLNESKSSSPIGEDELNNLDLSYLNQTIEDLNLTNPKWVESENENDSDIELLKIPFLTVQTTEEKVDDPDVGLELDRIKIAENDNDMNSRKIKANKLLNEFKEKKKTEADTKFLCELEEMVLKFISENDLKSKDKAKSILTHLIQCLSNQENSIDEIKSNDNENVNTQNKLKREGTFEIHSNQPETNINHKTPIKDCKIQSNKRLSHSVNFKSVPKGVSVFSTPTKPMRSRPSLSFSGYKKENISPTKPAPTQRRSMYNTRLSKTNTESAMPFSTNSQLRVKSQVNGLKSGPVKAMQPVKNVKTISSRISLNPKALRATITTAPVRFDSTTPIRRISTLTLNNSRRNSIDHGNNNSGTKISTPSRLSKLFTPTKFPC